MNVVLAGATLLWSGSSSANDYGGLALAALDERVLAPQIAAQSGALGDALSIELVAPLSDADTARYRDTVKPALALPIALIDAGFSLGLSPTLESLDGGVGSSRDHVALALPISAGFALGRWSLDGELGYSFVVGDDEWTLDTQLGFALSPKWSLSAVAIANAMPALDELRVRLRLATHWRPHDRLELIGAIGQGARDTPEITLAEAEETLGFVAIRWWL